MPHIGACLPGVPATHGLKCLDDLPADAWSLAPEPRDGYHFLGDAYVYGKPWHTLFNDGAIYSLVWESTAGGDR